MSASKIALASLPSDLSVYLMRDRGGSRGYYNNRADSTV